MKSGTFCAGQLLATRRLGQISPERFGGDSNQSGALSFDCRFASQCVNRRNPASDHSRRYIAASREESLYPERHLKQKFWSKLGRTLLLETGSREGWLHDGTLVGLKDGGRGVSTSTGTTILTILKAKALREVEWKTFQAAKKAWDEPYRRAGRAPPKLTLDDI